MNVFAAAHALTRKTLAAHGGDYGATFILALRAVYAERASKPRQVRLACGDRLSNRGYHRAGKPTWWARIGSGEFLRIGRVRGDECLDVTVEVPAGTREIHVGCGKLRSRDSIRATIQVDA